MACWGRGAQGGHLDFHTVPAPAVWSVRCFPWQVIYTSCSLFLSPCPPDERLREATGSVPYTCISNSSVSHTLIIASSFMHWLSLSNDLFGDCEFTGKCVGVDFLLLLFHFFFYAEGCGLPKGTLSRESSEEKQQHNDTHRY